MNPNQLQPSIALLGCLHENQFSSKQTTAEETSSVFSQPKRAEACKWSSFNFPSIITGEFTSAGSGPRLIPVVLPPGVAEHILCNSNTVSLSANSPSQNPSSTSYLSLTIAIITGDYRLFIYPAKTTWVSLLGYNMSILYSSHFPLYLSGPPISNPPTSESLTNNLITSPLAREGGNQETKDPLVNKLTLIILRRYNVKKCPRLLVVVVSYSTSESLTNYLITSPQAREGGNQETKAPFVNKFIILRNYYDKKCPRSLVAVVNYSFVIKITLIILRNYYEKKCPRPVAAVNLSSLVSGAYMNPSCHNRTHLLPVQAVIGIKPLQRPQQPFLDKPISLMHTNYLNAVKLSRSKLANQLSNYRRVKQPRIIIPHSYSISLNKDSATDYLITSIYSAVRGCHSRRPMHSHSYPVPSGTDSVTCLITPLDLTVGGSQSRPMQSYIIFLHSYPMLPSKDLDTNYLIISTDLTPPSARGGQTICLKHVGLIPIRASPTTWLTPHNRDTNYLWPRGTPFHKVLASPSALSSSIVSLSNYTVRYFCLQSIQLYSSGSWPQGAPLQQGRG